MSYLDRLKRKISAVGVETQATKPTKPSFVPFVAPIGQPLRQISSANDPSISEIFLTDAWRYGSAENLQEIARRLDLELFEERAGFLEFDGGHTRDNAELLAALDVLRFKGH